jgi:FkbM family methyltransferase
MERTDYYAPMTRFLVSEGAFPERGISIADVGMRGGASSVWNSLGKCADVIGFEPDLEEAERINAQDRMFHQHCYPFAIGLTGTQTIVDDTGNRASMSAHSPNQDWLSTRFDVGSFYDEDANPIDCRTKLHRRVARHGRTLEVETISLDDFVVRRPTKIDFIKIDVEGSELDVLKGASSILETALGVEIEVNFALHKRVPLFHEITAHLLERGFELYDLDMHRMSRGALPFPVSGDWRDHTNAPCLGPTTGGQPVTGDAVFFRDPILTRADSSRALVLSCLFEMYGFPDCAASILRYYKADLAVDVERCISILAKQDVRGYIGKYIKNKGRMKDA